MKLPTKLRYGLRFMANLASHYDTEEVVSISKISEEEGVSGKYLEQIISSFVKSKIVKGCRGKGGGYKLVKDPKDISIFEIAFILGEDFTYLPCIQNDDFCEKKDICSTNKLWKEYSDISQKLFKNTFLDSLIKH